MRIAAVEKARALAFIEVDELNRDGKVRFSELVDPMVKQFDFNQYPKNPEDFDLSDKGVTFLHGRLGSTVIENLTIFDAAMYVETPTSTEDSKKVLLDILEWGAASLGLTYSAGMIRRWAYISNLIFYTDFPILKKMSSPIENLSNRVSKFTETLWDGLEYQPASISIMHDQTLRKNPIAAFTIQHRINVSMLDNKYYSTSPMPTDLHIDVLEQFERDVLEQRT